MNTRQRDAFKGYFKKYLHGVGLESLTRDDLEKLLLDAYDKGYNDRKVGEFQHLYTQQRETVQTTDETRAALLAFFNRGPLEDKAFDLNSIHKLVTVLLQRELELYPNEQMKKSMDRYFRNSVPALREALENAMFTLLHHWAFSEPTWKKEST